MNFFRRSAFRLLPLWAWVALAVPTAAAANPAWVPVSPLGGSFDSIVRSPSSPRIVYAANPDGGLFRSDDDAKTWDRLTNPRAGVIAELHVDPDDPETVLALAEGLFLVRTQNGGRSWRRIGGGLPPVASITAEAHRPGGFLAATRSGLYRSSDQGSHWTLEAFPGRSLVEIGSDPFEEGNLLAVEQAEGIDHQPVWRSRDGGQSWVQVPLADDPLSFSQPNFVFDAARPATVYAFYHLRSQVGPRHLYRSTDGGTTWVRPTELGFTDLVSAVDGTLFATTGVGVLRSSDRGDLWEPAAPAPPAPNDRIFHLVASPSRAATVLATGINGVWKSVDRGTTWRESNRGNPVLSVADLAVAPIGPATVLAVGEGRIFRSADRGATWRRVHSQFGYEEPNQLAFDPRTPGNLYGVASDGQASRLFTSTDRGSTWTPHPFPYDCDGAGSSCEVIFSAFALDPNQPRTVYVSGSYFKHFVGFGNYLLRSRDGGDHWRSVTFPDYLGQLLVDPQNSAVLYGLNARRLYKSTDGAKTWRIVGRGLPARSRLTLALDPSDPERLYVGTGRGVFTSHDGGLTFQAMNAGIETTPIRTIRVDPTDPSRLYAAGPRTGVFRWDPARRRWNPLFRGLPIRQFEGLLILDPRDPTTLYAGTAGSGVLRLDLAEPTGGDTQADPATMVPAKP